MGSVNITSIIQTTRELAGKATERPWNDSMWAGDWEVTTLSGPRRGKSICSLSIAPDAAFIAHAANHIETLCDEVERLKGELAETRGRIRHFVDRQGTHPQDGNCSSDHYAPKDCDCGYLALQEESTK